MGIYVYTPEAELCEELPVCGCGDPELSYEMFRKWLYYCKKHLELAQEYDNWVDYRTELNKDKICKYFVKILYGDDSRYKEIYGAYQIINAVLDNLKCTEHGSSWWNSWLTEKGEKMLAALEIAKKHDYEFGPEQDWCYVEEND